MSGHSWSLPAPPSSSGGSSTSQLPTAVDQLFGKDVWLDLSDGNGPNTVVDRTGDWLLATGTQALRQSLIRRFITVPGEWATKPDYGAGATLFVRKRNSKASRDQLAERLRSQALKDPRVESVEEVAVSYSGEFLRISVRINPKGAPAKSQPLRVAFQLS